MFEELLETVERNYALESAADWNVDDAARREKARRLLEALERKWVKLAAATQQMLDADVFGASEIELLYSGHDVPNTCRIRVRPKRAYYLALRTIEPRPLNPDGNDAAGIELTTYLMRAAKAAHNIRPAYISFDFQVWGAHERTAFKSLWQDYQRIINTMVDALNFEFETACPNDRIDAYRGTKISEKLARYFAEDDDPENNFSITYAFSTPFDLAEVISACSILAALYDTCYHYSNKRNDFDRVVAHYQHLKDAQAI